MSKLEHYRLPSEAEMRCAIANRDAAYDAVFLYGVVTTGVFCLPSCAARPARPENLRFFLDAREASRAGLRECKRCRPLQAPAEHKALDTLAHYIVNHAAETFTLADLGKRVGLNPTVLQKRFVARFGVSPKALQAYERGRQLKSGLRSPQTVTESIYAAGYGSSSRFYESPEASIAMRPASYAAGGADETLYYAAGKTAVGLLLIAATGRGLCFAQFGNTKKELKDQLKLEFPKATLKPSTAEGSADLDAWLTALDQHLANKAPRPDIPLDLRGTAFQIMVWKFLLQIPRGQTRSYAEVSSSIGRASAVRAAASACGANRIAVLIPCHRVLRGDGSLGGYRWGTKRKRQLLATEVAEVTEVTEEAADST